MNWENIGVMVDDGSTYILLKPYMNLAGFPREEGRNHLIVSLFDHSEQRGGRRENFRGMGRRAHRAGQPRTV